MLRSWQKKQQLWYHRWCLGSLIKDINKQRICEVAIILCLSAEKWVFKSLLDFTSNEVSCFEVGSLTAVSVVSVFSGRTEVQSVQYGKEKCIKDRVFARYENSYLLSRVFRFLFMVQLNWILLYSPFFWSSSVDRRWSLALVPTQLRRII